MSMTASLSISEREMMVRSCEVWRLVDWRWHGWREVWFWRLFMENVARNGKGETRTLYWYMQIMRLAKILFAAFIVICVSDFKETFKQPRHCS